LPELTIFMNCTKHILVTILMFLYLFLPVQNNVHGAVFDAEISGLQISSDMPVKVPCNDCPCSDEHDSDCCDTTSCNCLCHAPLVQSIRFVYFPVVTALLQLEPHWSLPHVYFPIFVPPQSTV